MYSLGEILKLAGLLLLLSPFLPLILVVHGIKEGYEYYSYILRHHLRRNLGYFSASDYELAKKYHRTLLENEALLNLMAQKKTACMKGRAHQKSLRILEEKMEILRRQNKNISEELAKLYSKRDSDIWLFDDHFLAMCEAFASLLLYYASLLFLPPNPDLFEREYIFTLVLSVLFAPTHVLEAYGDITYFLGIGITVLGYFLGFLYANHVLKQAKARLVEVDAGEINIDFAAFKAASDAADAASTQEDTESYEDENEESADGNASDQYDEYEEEQESETDEEDAGDEDEYEESYEEGEQAQAGNDRLAACLRILEFDVMPQSHEILKRRYRQLIARYHPDRVHHLGRDREREAEEKTKQIIAAYEYVREYMQWK
ncbi:MAG: J domain-containing protein [Spirochaetaceae bacterium]|nr:J domain-containing protein [Spirochaetaceae bacterium]